MAALHAASQRRPVQRPHAGTVLAVWLATRFQQRPQAGGAGQGGCIVDWTEAQAVKLVKRRAARLDEQLCQKQLVAGGGRLVQHGTDAVHACGIVWVECGCCWRCLDRGRRRRH